MLKCGGLNNIKNCKNPKFGTSLVVQWLRNLPCNAGDMGSITGWETKIPHALKQLSPCSP